MEQRYIMTAFGVDRPGMVAEVTQLLYEQDCNLEDSSMTRLSDEFAMILLFTGRGENLEEQLSRACRRLERETGISAFFRPVEVPPASRKKKVIKKTLQIEGIDHAGIMYNVSKYLAGHSLNIRDLSSQLKFMPESGTAMYLIKMHIEVPEDFDMKILEQGIEELGDELHVDIKF